MEMLILFHISTIKGSLWAREDGGVDYLTYRATINGRTTKYPVAVLAEIVRLAER